MITTAELHRMAKKEGLRFDQTEKDYIILWVLSGLVSSGVEEHGWVFKGGTCLRHCYYRNYRFSEDIDFSCTPGKDNLETSLLLLERVAEWVSNESGVRMAVRDPLTVPGDFQIEVPMEYNRGGVRRQRLPQIKVHLTFDEPVLDETVDLSVAPGYSDLSVFEITSYSKKEIVAEKLRSLLQQQKKWPRPRDLYDLWYIMHETSERFSWQDLEPLFNEKCRIRDVQPDIACLTSDKLREWTENAWLPRLGPMLKNVPDFDRLWKEWVDAFEKLIADSEGNTRATL